MCVLALLVLFLPAVGCPFYEWRWSGGRLIDKRVPESDIAKIPQWELIGAVASREKIPSAFGNYLQFSVLIRRNTCSPGFAW